MDTHWELLQPALSRSLWWFNPATPTPALSPEGFCRVKSRKKKEKGTVCILHSAPPDSSWYCRVVCGCATKVTQTAIVFTCGIRTGWTSYTNYCLILIPYPCNQETEQEFVYMCCVCYCVCAYVYVLDNRHKSTMV